MQPMFLFSQSTNAYECFEKLPNSVLTLQLASYYYALQVYNLLSPHIDDTQASLYLHPPAHVVEHVIKSIRDRGETDDDVKFIASHLKRYHTQLADFAQARLLQGLGRGLCSVTMLIMDFTMSVTWKVL